MANIKGIVEKYHKSPDKPAGILIAGKWYNATDRTTQYITPNLEGTEVELTEQNGKITFIKTSESSIIETQTSREATPSQEETPEPHPATKGLAVKLAGELLNNVEVNTPEEWANKVCDAAEALLAEMKKRGLT
jgi:hypothetical protein